MSPCTEVASTAPGASTVSGINANISRTRKLPLRTSAYVLAIGRVGKATVLRGI